jgi:hypothetical protein
MIASVIAHALRQRDLDMAGGAFGGMRPGLALQFTILPNGQNPGAIGGDGTDRLHRDDIDLVAVSLRERLDGLRGEG